MINLCFILVRDNLISPDGKKYWSFVNFIWYLYNHGLQIEAFFEEFMSNIRNLFRLN